MTDVQTFRAANMQEALQRVRDVMGSDAVILNTREVSGRRRFPWRKRIEIEVTAGAGVNVRPVGPERSSDRTAAFQAGPSHSRPLPFENPFSDRRTPEPPSLADIAPPNFDRKLDSIQQMLADLSRTSHQNREDDIPSELFNLYTELIDAEVEEPLARDVIVRLKKEAAPDQLADTGTARTLLTAMVESELHCGGPIAPVPGKRRVVALVGTTGVGKTTTIAKLAANFRLRDKLNMALVTVDTYRIAAVEQLRTYAEIIDLPMKVVTNPLEMRRVMKELVGLDLVLIDTGGRSPRDEMQIQELKQLLNEAACDEVHLVMSATSSLRSLESTAQKFAPAKPTSLIMTKLDEAPSVGTLLSISRNVPLPITYLTTGQDVPEDIEHACPSRMARLILGQERVNQ